MILNTGNQFIVIATFDNLGLPDGHPMGYIKGHTYELRLVCLHEGRVIAEPINIEPKPLPCLYDNFIAFLNHWDNIKTTI